MKFEKPAYEENIVAGKKYYRYWAMCPSKKCGYPWHYGTKGKFIVGKRWGIVPPGGQGKCSKCGRRIKMTLYSEPKKWEPKDNPMQYVDGRPYQQTVKLGI